MSDTQKVEFLLKVIRGCTSLQQLEVALLWANKRIVAMYPDETCFEFCTAITKTSLAHTKRFRKLAITAEGWKY